MSTRIGDGRHHIEQGDEFFASRSAFFADLEVFARMEVSSSYRMHIHDRWQITWILSGVADLSHRGGSCLLHAGDAMIAVPFEPLAGRSCEGAPFGFVTLQVPRDLLSSRMDERVIARRGGAKLCQTLMERLMMATNGDEQREALDIAVSAFRAPSLERKELVPEGGRSHPAVERACSLLDESVDEKMPLTELGGAMRLNHRYMISIFKSAIGIPPHQYVMARRIESARRLLNEGQPLNTVAATVGFNDQSHLTRDFKRTFGVTPGAYQARHCHMNFLQNFPTAVS